MSEVTGTAANGTPTWVDLGIPDLARAKSFYSAIFGWEYVEGPPDTGGYTLATLRGRPVAALAPNQDAAATSFWWQMYFATDDVDGTLKRAVDAGSTVVAPAMDVMDQGRLAMVKDPQGAQFGLWHGRAMPGAGLIGEPGAMAWNELVTADASGAAAFYSATLDRPVESMNAPGFDYFTVKVDGRDVAGIWGVSDASAPRWTTYFAVGDADEAARVAAAQGGKVVAEPKDSPYGRFAILQDPFGAEFAAMKLPEERAEQA